MKTFSIIVLKDSNPSRYYVEQSCTCYKREKSPGQETWGCLKIFSLKTGKPRWNFLYPFKSGASSKCCVDQSVIIVVCTTFLLFKQSKLSKT